MPRTARASAGNVAYHVINRGNARNDADSDAKERILLPGLDVAESLVAEFPNEPRHARSLAQSLIGLAELQISRDEYEEALRLAQRAIPIGEELVADTPTDLGFYVELEQNLLTAGRAAARLRNQQQAGCLLCACFSGVAARHRSRSAQ